MDSTTSSYKLVCLWSASLIRGLPVTGRPQTWIWASLAGVTRCAIIIGRRRTVGRRRAVGRPRRNSDCIETAVTWDANSECLLVFVFVCLLFVCCGLGLGGVCLYFGLQNCYITPPHAHTPKSGPPNQIPRHTDFHTVSWSTPGWHVDPLVGGGRSQHLGPW